MVRTRAEKPKEEARRRLEADGMIGLLGTFFFRSQPHSPSAGYLGHSPQTPGSS